MPRPNKADVQRLGAILMTGGAADLVACGIAANAGQKIPRWWFLAGWAGLIGGLLILIGTMFWPSSRPEPAENERMNKAIRSAAGIDIRELEKQRRKEQRNQRPSRIPLVQRWRRAKAEVEYLSRRGPQGQPAPMETMYRSRFEVPMGRSVDHVPYTYGEPCSREEYLEQRNMTAGFHSQADQVGVEIVLNLRREFGLPIRQIRCIVQAPNKSRSKAVIRERDELPLRYPTAFEDAPPLPLEPGFYGVRWEYLALDRNMQPLPPILVAWDSFEVGNAGAG